MKIWTVQHRRIAKTLNKQQVFLPDFNRQDPSKKYGFMRSVYPMLLQEYKERNKLECPGLIFGFSHLGGLTIESFEQFHGFFCSYPNTSYAFHFWEPEYCLLELEINDSIDTVPITVNDFTKLAMEQNNDFSGIRDIEKTEGNDYSFDQDVSGIKNKFKAGIASDNWCVQVHYHLISKHEIVNVYPMFNYKTQEIFKMYGDFKGLIHSTTF